MAVAFIILLNFYNNYFSKKKRKLQNFSSNAQSDKIEKTVLSSIFIQIIANNRRFLTERVKRQIFILF